MNRDLGLPGSAPDERKLGSNPYLKHAALKSFPWLLGSLLSHLSPLGKISGSERYRVPDSCNYFRLPSLLVSENSACSLLLIKITQVGIFQ